MKQWRKVTGLALAVWMTAGIFAMPVWGAKTLPPSKAYMAIRMIQMGSVKIGKKAELDNYSGYHDISSNAKSGIIKVTPNAGWRVERVRFFAKNRLSEDQVGGDAGFEDAQHDGTVIINGSSKKFGTYFTAASFTLVSQATGDRVTYETSLYPFHKVEIKYGAMINKKTQFVIRTYDTIYVNYDGTMEKEKYDSAAKFLYNKKAKKKSGSQFSSKKNLVSDLKDLYGYAKLKGKKINVRIQKIEGKKMKVSVKKPGKKTKIRIIK